MDWRVMPAMRVAGRFLPLAGAAILAACGTGETDNAAVGGNNAALPPVALDNSQQAVVGLPEGQRNGVLLRAIRDAREPCQNVVSSIAAETRNGLPVYFATCEDNAVYAVAIGGDGNATVRAVTPAEQRK